MLFFEAHKILFEKFGSKILGLENQTGRQVVMVHADSIVEVVQFLKDEPMYAFDLLVDLSGADYSGYPEHVGPELCVSYQLLSTTKQTRCWIKVYLPMAEATIATLSSVYAAANWYERECWDMYGIRFTGHPYLKRLLMYEEFEGHPLRKSYPILKMQPLIPMRDAVDYENVARLNRADRSQGS